MNVDVAILTRLQKLLALSGSPNVHEAAAAASRAQALVDRHRLQGWLDAERGREADPDPISDARDEPLEVAKRIRRWKGVLAATLATASGCVAYTLQRARREQALVLVGRSRDRVLVRALYEGLVKRIEWLSATEGPGRPRQWHEAFRIGVVDTIAHRLAEPASPEVSGTALARVDQAALAHRVALERYVETHLGLRSGRSLRVDTAGWKQGREAGQGLVLPGSQLDAPERDRDSEPGY